MDELPEITIKDLDNTIKLITRLKDISGDEVDTITALKWKFTKTRDLMVGIQKREAPEVPAPEVNTPSESAPTEPLPDNDSENQANTGDNPDTETTEGV